MKLPFAYAALVLPYRARTPRLLMLRDEVFVDVPELSLSELRLAMTFDADGGSNTVPTWELWRHEGSLFSLVHGRDGPLTPPAFEAAVGKAPFGRECLRSLWDSRGYPHQLVTNPIIPRALCPTDCPRLDDVLERLPAKERRRFTVIDDDRDHRSGQAATVLRSAVLIADGQLYFKAQEPALKLVDRPNGDVSVAIEPRPKPEEAHRYFAVDRSDILDYVATYLRRSAKIGPMPMIALLDDTPSLRSDLLELGEDARCCLQRRQRCLGKDTVKRSRLQAAIWRHLRQDPDIAAAMAALPSIHALVVEGLKWPIPMTLRQEMRQLAKRYDYEKARVGFFGDGLSDDDIAALADLS